MVGFAGRLRKPRQAIALESPHEEGLVPSPTPTTPERFTPPVLRNFSYPTTVGSPEQPPQFPSTYSPGQTTWDQLGDICNFSPISVSRVGQARPDDPFFFKSEAEPYSLLDDEDESFGIGISPEHLADSDSASQDGPKARKKQRRSTLLGLPSSQAYSSSRL
ncbi:uncharacterized protein F4822DRAFT_67966 [Hypoxylon trugodes]|uniref:uncharacterized protein n=1 Tax=Hypoxylon trugodes TaxID=326681 RepID=UPI00218FD06F|nr:uncharacterized protein F4822DRAFT_67966 [Hypoxylon trugodes]KAI1383187.1 hypothetical protein F4822DRAFT_67966 [Hypoxylon trugodes]